jgi:hypothetical protein
MVYYCKRCKDHGEIRLTNNPKNKVSVHLNSIKKINASGIVTLVRGRGALCPKCLDELLTWLKD